MKNVNRRTFIQKTVLGGIGVTAFPKLHLTDVGSDTNAGIEPHDMSFIKIDVKDTAGLNTLRSVTGGVPIPEGAAPAGCRFMLTGSNNKPVPCQSEVLAKWKDGSARWVLLDFQAAPAPNGSEQFRLTWGFDLKEVRPSDPVRASQSGETTLGSGKVRLKTIPGSLLRVSDRFDVRLVMNDRYGKRCEAVATSSKIEKSGYMRSTLALAGSFRTPEGARVVDFRLRASVYAGLSQFYIEPQILVNADNEMIQYLNSLNLEFIPLKSVKSASIGGDPGWKSETVQASTVRLFQVDDENYVMEGALGKGKKAPGWMELNDGAGTIAFSLRDFWQQWPKSLEVDQKAARMGLFPEFTEGAFSHMGPWYKHDYLFEGNSYRLREGQSRRWQVWVDLSGNGESLSKAINMSLIPVADPTQAIATGEWGPIAPAGTNGMAEYDKWADNLFEGYCRSIREQRDYGAMNWGDWWGERRCNWGNHEYDTPLVIFMQFARTGDPKYFYVGEQSTRHLSEVDVVHFVNDGLKQYFKQWETAAYPSRPGMVHEHSIGHVGGFHPVEKIRQLYVDLRIEPTAGEHPYLCLDPFNLGHIFTIGMAHYYLLTGDPWVKETLDCIGDNLMRLTEEGYKFKSSTHCGRVNGWSMLALGGVYKVSPSERCLKAMQKVAEDALSEQDPNCGGWLYTMAADHCMCKTHRHVGEAGFIGSIRLNGLSYYYRLTSDERIQQSILRGVTHLNNDTWREEKNGWRYTSCPASSFSGQTGVTIMALVNSVSINGDAEHLRILRKAWDVKFANLLKIPATRPGLGKEYSTIMYGSPEAMNLFVNGAGKFKKSGSTT
jgi:hypothetical protein